MWLYPIYDGYVSPSGTSTYGWIEFNFAAPQTINSMWVWNYNGVGRLERGWAYTAVDYSTDNGVTWNRLGGTNNWFLINKVPSEQFTPANSQIDFGGISGITNVLLNARAGDGIWCYNLPFNENYDYANGGLSEVKFEVPEPVTMIMLGLGALALRTRKSA
jgi:hypothetical protein